MMVDLFSPFFTVGKYVVTGCRTTRQHVTCNEEGVRNLSVSPLAPKTVEKDGQDGLQRKPGEEGMPTCIWDYRAVISTMFCFG